jgi:hypothetical protein
MSIMLTHARTRIFGASGAVTVALLAAAAAPAPAQTPTPSPTAAACITTFTGTFTPGFSMTPGSGTLTTNGETGAFTCLGRIGGDRVTGPGVIAVDESYTGSCLSHTGTGTVRITIPTSGGSKDMTGTLTVRRTGLIVTPIVQFPDARYRGIGLTIPAEGNCFATPLRRAHIALLGVMRGT